MRVADDDHIFAARSTRSNNRDARTSRSEPSPPRNVLTSRLRWSPETANPTPSMLSRFLTCRVHCDMTCIGQPTTRATQHCACLAEVAFVREQPKHFGTIHLWPPTFHFPSTKRLEDTDWDVPCSTYEQRGYRRTQDAVQKLRQNSSRRQEAIHKDVCDTACANTLRRRGGQSGPRSM